MFRLIFTLFVVASTSLAQSASDGSFSVQHSKRASFFLSSAQMREAESLYRSACTVVQHNFPNRARELRPHFTVVIGADHNQVQGKMALNNRSVGAEIRLKKWDPTLFAQAVVVLAYYDALTSDVIKQLGNRAVQASNATVDISGLK
jgi:hypothetical protein